MKFGNAGTEFLLLYLLNRANSQSKICFHFFRHVSTSKATQYDCKMAVLYGYSENEIEIDLEMFLEVKLV